MPHIDWPQWITTFVALYAAFLATWGEAARRRGQQRSLRVDLSTGFPVDDSGPGRPAVLITTINPGFQPITIHTVGIQVAGRNFIAFTRPQSDVTFPHELTGGKSCMVWTDAAGLAETLCTQGLRGEVELAGYVRDALGRTHIGKKLGFHVEGWLDKS
jgi:hypothetical protein